MCATCGCSGDSGTKLTNLQTGEVMALAESHSHHHHHEHSHHHGDAHPHQDGHEHHHDHGPGHAHGTVVTLEKEVLASNNRMAERVRGWLAGRGILALNLVSSPGAGKTTLLERTIRDLGGKLEISVIEGDQQTLNDARRIQEAGCRVVQINTGTACHLDASMIARALTQLDPPSGSIVMVENVGNLVCPALFDLGERAKVVIASVTEGEDKPIKYPHMFRAGSLMVLNKIDLLPHLRFDVERCLDYARQANPRIKVLRLSAETGEGLTAWYDWLRQQTRQIREGSALV
ncbi:MAG: hydrogenase nickel incorporation protein HypB [Isosphaeraceae bacterium]